MNFKEIYDKWLINQKLISVMRHKKNRIITPVTTNLYLWSTDMSFKDMFDDCSKNLDYGNTQQIKYLLGNTNSPLLNYLTLRHKKLIELFDTRSLIMNYI